VTLLLRAGYTSVCDTPNNSYYIHWPNSLTSSGLHYPDLDFTARKEIWKSFITKVQTDEPESQKAPITIEEIDRLASHPLNGRQIKNLIASARSVARENGESMDVEHIGLVLDVMTAWSEVKA